MYNIYNNSDSKFNLRNFKIYIFNIKRNYWNKVIIHSNNSVYFHFLLVTGLTAFVFFDSGFHRRRLANA